ncbi:MAG: hypothetical protein Q8L75_19310, partial [Acidobacteriota bacterium]|nr:hypothetical protein [Acidobacteriota bacterium]
GKEYIVKDGDVLLFKFNVSALEQEIKRSGGEAGRRRSDPRQSCDGVLKKNVTAPGFRHRIRHFSLVVRSLSPFVHRP